MFHRMETRYLKLVKSIVEEGSIARASEKLFLTPSALSHQLKEAESVIGTRLFDRANKRLLLTLAGEKVYEAANDVLGRLNAVEKQIAALNKGTAGSITLSTECYTSYFWLPAVIQQFEQEYPNVEIKINFNATHKPLEKLLEGDLDLALVNSKIPGNALSYLEVFEDEMVGIAAKNHAWADLEFLSPADFTDQNLIIHSEPISTVTVYRDFMKPAGFELKEYTPVPLTEAAVQMVKAKMGVMVLANWALQPYSDDDKLILRSLGAQGLRRKHYVASLTGKDYPDYFKHFIHYLSKFIQP